MGRMGQVGLVGLGRSVGRMGPTHLTTRHTRQQRQYVNVPKNADRLFGSLHFVPSDEPVKKC
jgi:hypothetical protein